MLWEELEYLLFCSFSEEKQNELVKAMGLGLCAY